MRRQGKRLSYFDKLSEKILPLKNIDSHIEGGKRHPYSPRKNNTAMMFEGGFQEAINWAPIMPRGTSLSFGCTISHRRNYRQGLIIDSSIRYRSLRDGAQVRCEAFFFLYVKQYFCILKDINRVIFIHVK